MSDITVHTLTCGAALIVERMTGVRSAAASMMIPGGSACDPADAQGRGTLWVELLLRGSASLSSREQADAFDRLGVSRSTDLGAYTVRIAAGLLGQNAHAALPLLMDMVLRPRMDDEAVEPCRDLAIQAIESLKDDPQERASHLARERHFPSPINRSGLGTPEGLAGLTGERLRSDWHATALAKGSILAFAGDLDARSLIDQLETITSGWSGTAFEPPTEPRAQRGYGHAPDPSNQVQIIVLHDAPPESHPDSILEKVVVNVLSGGMAGRLFTEVREKRALCYSVSAGYRGDRDFGSLSAYVGTTPEKAQESLDVLFAQLAHLRTPEGQITVDEFRRAIIGMKSSLVFSGESSGARAASLASDFRRLGRPRSLDEIAAQVDAVTLDQVNAYLARRVMGRVTIQTLGPTELTPPAAAGI
jgi:predicted Zn-dependent peptidase